MPATEQTAKRFCHYIIAVGLWRERETAEMSGMMGAHFTKQNFLRRTTAQTDSAVAS